ncbi:hypothetical protein BD769DRAFT_1676337 [Suillus cothurnatus]|nr:hypothetical protein BD769DRAFT_1676337 [Suillus cothurnatus]
MFAVAGGFGSRITHGSRGAGKRSAIGSAMVFSQSDGLKRRGSFSSTAGAFDMASMSDYDYKGPDDTTDLDGVKAGMGEHNRI